MSFLLGKCPSESVTFDGGPDVATPLPFVDILRELTGDKMTERDEDSISPRVLRMCKLG